MFKKISLWLMFLSLPMSALAEGSGKSSKTNDQGEVLKLQSIFVGDREQPSVSYFIPWGEVAESRGFQWRVDRGNRSILNWLQYFGAHSIFPLGCFGALQEMLFSEINRDQAAKCSWLRLNLLHGQSSC